MIGICFFGIAGEIVESVMLREKVLKEKPQLGQTARAANEGRENYFRKEGGRAPVSMMAFRP